MDADSFSAHRPMMAYRRENDALVATESSPSLHSTGEADVASLRVADG